MIGAWWAEVVSWRVAGANSTWNQRVSPTLFMDFIVKRDNTTREALKCCKFTWT